MRSKALVSLAALLAFLLLLAGCAEETGESEPEPETGSEMETEPDAEDGESADGLLTQAEFVQEWKSYFTDYFSDYNVREGTEEHSLIIAAPGQVQGLTLFTDNAYAEYLRAPEDYDDILQWYVDAVKAGLEEQDDDDEISAEDILPTLKVGTYVEDLGEYGEDLVYEPYLDQMLIVYAVDTPYAVRMLQHAHLEQLQLAREDLYDLALGNLERMAADLYIDDYEGALWPVIGESAYLASLLLLDIWDEAHFPVDGDIIVCVPERDQMAVTGSDDTETVELLREYAASTFAVSGYPVYDGLLQWTGEGFVPYL